MIPVFTSEQMRQCDASAIEHYGIPGIALMENASMGAVEYLGECVPRIMNMHFLILCGAGNNGGDGFGMARHILNRGGHVTVLKTKADEEISGDAALNLSILRKMEGNTPLRISDATTIDEVRSRLEERPDIVIDALLGTGLDSDVRGITAEIIDAVNTYELPVFAVDIPSGIHADNGRVLGSAMKCLWTATMGGIKRGLLLGEGREYAGDVRTIDIGTPLEAIFNASGNTYLIDESEIYPLLPTRSLTTHKYEAGTVFAIAGSPGLTGAAVMACNAALRSGAGIVKLGAPKGIHDILEIKLTEVMTVPLDETLMHTLSCEAMDEVLEQLEAAKAGILGPGLGRIHETMEFTPRIIPQSPVPLVVDADALFALAENCDCLSNATQPMVLTPHYGEFRRLLGITKEELLEDPVGLAREFAGKHGVTLVLKGAPTLVASSDGDVVINSTGNPGMATAGSGDVLTGMIAGLIAQGVEPEDAAILGVYMHGRAGDLAGKQKGELSLTAGDILDHIPAAFQEVQ
ncbi:MAG: bifunctional ADP-dependent NAD(P)H-hydrate dehydratase/NAD(P)H-hydrate epimerase [Ectothiorhodospiraceae bacterium]|nr:bifunctional ADP-dependent NAD(P)H-hydrate dehydratase/NAD(P)H-hydrate epimerase [Ectothiorhodospiraceae bacterium]